jgi:hypothetical protein
MSDPHFFGYGSLVNTATHSYPDTRTAHLSGFRRRWRHTSLRDVAYLTVEQAPGHIIAGLIAAVPNGDWAALDLREAAYDRLLVAPELIHHDHPHPITVEVYKTSTANDAPPSTRHPILLSYLDTVVSGYRQIFGQEGAQAFFTSTDGWDAPVLNDRAHPIYPRTTPLSRQDRILIDSLLDDHSVQRITTR